MKANVMFLLLATSNMMFAKGQGISSYIKRPFVEAEHEIDTGFENYDKFYAKYSRTLPFLIRLCSESRPDSNEYCNLKYLVMEFEAIHANLKAVMNRENRRFTGIHYEDVDIEKYLNTMKQSLEIRNEIKNLNRNINRRFDHQDSQMKNIQTYYKELAEFDIAVAGEDIIYLRKKLNVLMRDLNSYFSGQSQNTVSYKMSYVIGSALAAARLESVKAIADTVFEVFKLLNPIQLVKEYKTNKMALLRRVTSIFDSDGLIRKAARIFRSAEKRRFIRALDSKMNEFLNHLRIVLMKLHTNNRHLFSMEDILESLETDEASDILDQADSYIDAYKGFKPLLTRSDFLGLLDNLRSLTQAACDTVRVTNPNKILRIFVKNFNKPKAMRICRTVMQDLALLDTYFTDVYEFQFELRDAFTDFMKGHVAKATIGTIAGQTFINETESQNKIIALTMDEISIQGATQSFCNVLEYERGGVRPDECKRNTFTKTQINRIKDKPRPAWLGNRAANGGASSGQAFIPSSEDSDFDSLGKTYINVQNLLEGKAEFFTIPNDAEWLRKYGWIGKQEVPGYEEAVFVKRLELFIPGLQCNNDPNDVNGEIKITNDELVQLHISKANTSDDNGVPGYMIKPLTYVFKWGSDTTDQCEDLEQFEVKRTNGSSERGKQIKYITKGYPQKMNSDLYPGLFTTWQITLHNYDCILQIENVENYDFLITAKYELVKWNHPEDSDECWPAPCMQGGICRDLQKDYTCDCPNGTEGKSCDGGMPLTQETCDRDHNIALHRPTGMTIETPERRFSYLAVDDNVQTCAVSKETETPWFYIELPWHAQLCEVVINGSLAEEVLVVLSEQKPKGNVIQDLDNVLPGEITKTGNVYNVKFPQYLMGDGYRYMIIYETDVNDLNQLQICDVQAYSTNRVYNDKECDWSTNLLETNRGQITVSQISTMAGDWEAELAVDNHQATCSRTEFYTDATKPWYMIEFPTRQQICGVKITPPDISVSANGLHNVEVGMLMSENVKEGQEISLIRPCGNPLISDPLSFSSSDKFSIACEELPIDGEKLVFKSNAVDAFLSLCDIEVFGTKF